MNQILNQSEPNHPLTRMVTVEKGKYITRSASNIRFNGKTGALPPGQYLPFKTSCRSTSTNPSEMSKGAEIDGDEKTQGMDYSLSSSCRCGRGFAGSGGWLQGPGASRGPCQGGRGAVRGRCPNISGTAAFNQPREERVQLQPKMKNWTDRAAIWPPLSLPLPFIFAKDICKI